MARCRKHRRSTSTTALVTGTGANIATMTATTAGVSGSAYVTIEPATEMRVYDTFAEAIETPLPSHVPAINATGQPWVVTGPLAVVRNGQLVPEAYHPAMYATALIETRMANGTIAVDWTAAAASTTLSGYPIGSLIVRGVNADNHLAVGYGLAGGSTLALWRVVDGAWTDLGTTVLPSLEGQTHRLEVRLDGAHIEVWADGTLALTATEPRFRTATRHGFRWWTGYDWTSTFDHFVVHGPEFQFCAYALSPGSAVLSAAGGSGSVAVSGGVSGCEPSLASDVSWLSVSGDPATGAVAYAVAPSTSPSPRTGTIQIGQTVFAVTQAAAPASGATVMHDTFTGDTGTPLAGHVPDLNTTSGTWTVEGAGPVLHAGQLTPGGYDPN